MKGNEILALLDEPACEHNHKQKSGCSAPKPGATAGGCAFDGAQITLLPIADVAHLVHGPIEELREKHGQLAAVAPLPSAHFTKPSIVIKPNANSRPTGDTTGYLANPKEV